MIHNIYKFYLNFRKICLKLIFIYFVYKILILNYFLLDYKCFII
jgi:hypothetical protein